LFYFIFVCLETAEYTRSTLYSYCRTTTDNTTRPQWPGYFGPLPPPSSKYIWIFSTGFSNIYIQYCAALFWISVNFKFISTTHHPRTLLVWKREEIARSLKLVATIYYMLNMFFWEFRGKAITCAVNTRNQISINTISSITLYKILRGPRQNVSHLQIPGSIAFIYHS
jgi:hypothetical protein